MNKNFDKYNRNQLAFIAEYNTTVLGLDRGYSNGLEADDIEGEAQRYQ